MNNVSLAFDINIQVVQSGHKNHFFDKNIHVFKVQKLWLDIPNSRLMTVYLQTTHYLIINLWNKWQVNWNACFSFWDLFENQQK